MKYIKKQPIPVNLHPRTHELLVSLRDIWFPDEEDPMPVEDFIYTLCCSAIYSRQKRK